MKNTKAVCTAILAGCVTAGCMQSVPSTETVAADAAPTGKTAEVIQQSPFEICPAFAAGQSLERFDEKGWAEHLEIAVAQPNTLNEWTVDFSTASVVRYSMGSQPSLGYAVELVPPLRVDGDTLLIPVRQSEPRPGTISGAAMTSPCLYVQVEDVGFSKASVVDAETGAVIKELE